MIDTVAGIISYRGHEGLEREREREKQGYSFYGNWTESNDVPRMFRYYGKEILCYKI